MAFKLRKDSDGFHPNLSAFGVHSVVCRVVGACDLQPIQLALNPQATLVKVHDIRRDELLLDGIETGLNLIDHRRMGIQHQGFRWHMSVKVSPHLLPTLGTHLDFGLVFGDFDAHRGNIKYLPFLISARLNGLQLCGAMGTDAGFMYSNMVWLLHHLEGVPLVSFLTTTTTAALLAQTARARLLQTIAARWFAALLAVLSQLVTQYLNSSRLFSYRFFAVAAPVPTSSG